jgi:type I restriction-modification system DNA methylase subunit
MTPPKIVTELVERFDRNKNVYCGSGYNETRLRREFLDPLFEALGWDVDNKRGVSPLYQDVVHEYPTEVDHSQKAADYAFRVGEKVKFFVEAKKPGTRLRDDAGPALQLRRYAYSAGLPLSILTDFEEFAAYDGRVPPKKADAASRARLMYFTYEQYVDAWDEIAAVFSKDAVWSGAFDKFAEEKRGGKAEPPDKLFLKLLEGWRDHLARNVANRNREKDLDKFELSGAVQAILDRMIFLRVAEDRGIESPGRLAALEEGDNVYGRLMELCLEADDVYNSGLFHFRDEKGRATSRDELTPHLRVDDATLRKIIRELYDSPYEFGVVPVEILGQVYEQFLGKTIWLDGRGVHIDYKPEVRKAKGVYYTPQYIVEYIVKNTVGELLKGCKNPRDAARLKILDPACGSGSFLLGAYQHLINWHLEWYVADGPAKHEGKVVATPGPGPASWRLTAAAKKDILVNNLFGVDIDPQAVEVTKLSLLLKALEGESRESVGAQTKFLRERILPDLGDNVKCGNSLIGSDYWDFVREKQETLLDIKEDERRRVNPFDWEVEFPDIFDSGLKPTARGFDAVIGNPPYVRVQNLGYEEIDYYKSKYRGAFKRLDISILFFELGFNVVKGNGLLGYISSMQFFTGEFGEKIRELISEYKIMEIIDFGGAKVFEGPTTYPAVFILKKAKPDTFKYKSFSYDSSLNFEEICNAETTMVDVGNLGNKPWVLEDPKITFLMLRLSDEFPSLSDLGSAHTGIITGFDDAFVLTDEQIVENGIEPDIIVPLVKGRDPKRYFLKTPSHFVIYPYEIDKNGKTALMNAGRFGSEFPNAYNHLQDNKNRLSKRKDSRKTFSDFKSWYSLVRFSTRTVIDQEKILTPGEVKRNSFSLDDSGYAFLCARVFGITSGSLNLKYLLGLLNSRLVEFFMHRISAIKRGGYYSYNANVLKRIPLPNINNAGKADVARHDNMVALVEEMLALHKRLAAAKSDADKQRLQRAIAATDRKIDALVYELYGLTDEEIKIVES